MVRLANIRRRLRAEDGFSLAEALVAATLTVTVLFALYALFDITVRAYDSGGARIEAIQNARVGLERMQRELRAAHPYGDGSLLRVHESDEISFQIKPGETPQEIRYTFSSPGVLRRNGQQLARSLDASDGLRLEYCATPTECSAAVTDEGEIRLVRVTLNVRPSGAADEALALTTDVLLRNR